MPFVAALKKHGTHGFDGDVLWEGPCSAVDTVEEPVEFRLPGINQVASDNEYGMGFANALKYIMRQEIG